MERVARRRLAGFNADPRISPGSIEGLRGRRSITADTALRLSRYLGTTAKFWLNPANRFRFASGRANQTERHSTRRNGRRLASGPQGPLPADHGLGRGTGRNADATGAQQQALWSKRVVYRDEFRPQDSIRRHPASEPIAAPAGLLETLEPAVCRRGQKARAPLFSYSSFAKRFVHAGALDSSRVGAIAWRLPPESPQRNST